ncbi:hypothetical protein [uncultured Deinococcus sp.]|uniref:hypothetical protein n=1 Tax=uncultured Deinococcus sp. TaxID=158789 RepID=UPI0025D4FB7B|nr:hypothetical protein [uncultured Deinococcus sp.]
MPPALHELLLSLDDPKAWEAPLDFDRDAGLRRVKVLSDSVRETLKLHFTLDEQVQDASFFADLWTERPGQRAVGLRFSSFGMMVLGFTDNVRALTSQSFPPELLTLLREHNYIALHPEQVDHPYDGINSHLRGWADTTWFQRYFDYL